MGEICSRCGEDAGFAYSHREMTMCIEALAKQREVLRLEVSRLSQLVEKPHDDNRLAFLLDTFSRSVRQWLSDSLTTGSFKVLAREWLEDVTAYEKRADPPPDHPESQSA